MSNSRYRLGKGYYLRPSGIKDERFFAYDPQEDRWAAFYDASTRAKWLDSAHGVWNSSLGSNNGRGLPSDSTLYGGIVWDDDTEVNYQQKYSDLVDALAKEAYDRNWCAEFDTFAAKAGIDTSRLRKNVKVTLEFEVGRLDSANIEVAAHYIRKMTSAELTSAIRIVEVI